MKRILFITTCYGSTPHFLLMKYLDEMQVKYTVFVVPAVKSAANVMEIRYLRIEGNSSITPMTWNTNSRLIRITRYFSVYVIHLYTLVRILTEYKKGDFDCCFAEASFNACLGRLCKLLGYVDRTVFINGDRISNTTVDQARRGGLSIKFLNAILFASMYVLKKFAAKSDIVWSPSPAITEWDRRIGIKTRRIIHCRGAQDHKMALRGSERRRERHSFCFLGEPSVNSGIYKVLDALKVYAEIYGVRPKLTLVGGSPLSCTKLAEYAESQGIPDCIDIFGFVVNPSDVYNILSSSRAGLAMYSPNSGNPSLGVADNGKIKCYIDCALPIILTKGCMEIEQNLGKRSFLITSDYNTQSIVAAMHKVGSEDESAYRDRLDDIVSYAGENDYRLVYYEFLNTLRKVDFSNVDEPHNKD